MTKTNGLIEVESPLLMKQISRYLKSKYHLRQIDFKILKWVPVLHQGWEMDEWAVVVKLDGVGHILIHTDHGSPYLVESPKKFLRQQNLLYRRAINQSNSVMRYFRT